VKKSGWKKEKEKRIGLRNDSYSNRFFVGVDDWHPFLIKIEAII